jgi:ABC-type nickel/cobalt efflux system permease component RcnA
LQKLIGESSRITSPSRRKHSLHTFVLPMGAGCALTAPIGACAAIAARSYQKIFAKPNKSGGSTSLAATLPYGIVHHK